MRSMLLYPIGTTAACRYAAAFLKNQGATLVDHPTPEVTHLLLDIPSFASDGSLRGGGDLDAILRTLPPDTTIIGGNLGRNYKNSIDLLTDEGYLASNAAITAECALRVAGQHLPTTLSDARILILGWGRIGKCLSLLLQKIGTDVTIAARSRKDCAMAGALGLRANDFSTLRKCLSGYTLVFNTVPELVLRKEDTAPCKRCILIDLASKPGIEGDNVLIARGLPGVYAPESSGKLIADTILRLSGEVCI